MYLLAASRRLSRHAPSAASRRTLKLLVGATARPHSEKVFGEDAYFASASDGTLGVADGVGGSKREGVDPGDFSRRLCAYAAEAARSSSAAASVAVARRRSTEDDLCRRGGSSTLLVARLDGDTLEVCNFGDSGAALFRPSPRTSAGSVGMVPRTVLRTADQTHYFNCPFQASAEDDLAEPLLGACGADALAATARVGDVVVLATDGFWDNVHDEETRAILSDRIAVLWASAAKQQAFGPLSDRVRDFSSDAEAGDDAADVLDATADALAAAAAAVFDDAEAVTPFTLGARADGLHAPGGKEDDLTVVVALVVDDAVEHTARDAARRDNFGAAGLDDGATPPGAS